jgi:site-specific recombinase XerD
MPLTRGTRASLCSTSRNVFHTALEEASIENSTWHDFRDGYAARLVIAGVSLSAVAELLRYRGIRMVMRSPIDPPAT